MDRAGSLSSSHLVVAISVQSLLYGAFLVISVLNYWALMLRCSYSPHPKKVLFGLSLTMFILATLHIISCWTSAFTGSDSNIGSLGYLLLISNGVFCFLQTLVGDCIALYRCWIVLGRWRTFVALPALLVLGSIATGIGMLINIARFVQGSKLNFQLWVICFFSTSLATSLVCTSIIVKQIWSLPSTKRSRSLSLLIPILLESGALYSGILIMLLIFLATNSWFQYVLIEALPSIIGILFSIILIRTGLGLSIDGPQPSSPSSWSPPSTKSHYFKSSNPPKDLNNSFASSSPSTGGNSHRPLILPLILSQTQKRRGSIIEQQQQQQQQQQQHYNLRSQLPQPSSYFRTSEDIGIDIELEFEIDEARYKIPKSLPINHPSKIHTTQL